MKKLITFIFFLLLILIWLSSCSRRVITQTVEHTIIDSVYVTLKPRDTTIYIPGDTVRITDIIECDSITNKPKPINISSRSGRAQAQVQITADGRLNILAHCDSLEQVITVMDKEIFRLRQEKRTINVVTEKKPSKLRVWANNIAWTLAIIFLAIILIRLITKKLFI
jgi:hypothetical protein